MLTQVTDDLKKAFREKKIFFEVNSSHYRLEAGQNILFMDECVVEPYCGLLGGHTIPSIGSFSYTWSPLPPQVSIGRYCSIAPGMCVPGPRHTVEKISTSSFMYDRHFSIFKDFNGRSK